LRMISRQEVWIYAELFVQGAQEFVIEDCALI
jgi:hypothetical protein